MEYKKNSSSNTVNSYVIDKEFRLQYMCDNLRQKFPCGKNGDFCYVVFREQNEPCRNCPLVQKNRRTDMLYNEKKKQWIKLEAGEIQWPGAEGCHVVLARDIGEKDLDDLARFVSMKRDIMEHKTQAAKEKNQLTGLFSRDAFFHQTEAFLRAGGASAQEYCMAAIDIEHFKLFNEWYGEAAGNKLLGEIGEHLRLIRKEIGGIAGYMGEDDFAMLIPNKEEVLTEMQKKVTGFVRAYGGHTGFLPAFGYCVIEDVQMKGAQMYDRAILAQKSVKGNYAVRAGYYSSDMKKELENNHVLLTEVQTGLEKDEFIFYLQPKCNLNTGKIVGLESLVRWAHPTKGIVSPGYFIPIMENNGLITELDKKVWEQVCQMVRCWMDKGKRVIPISVNVSSVDIYAIDVVDYFKTLVKKYNIPPKYIELEITESAYVEEYKVITGVAEALRQAGFTVLMDDFGSGYSSLNMLKDVTVDVLKIDMKFLRMDENTLEKGMGILEAVTRMANIMGLRMIAEGVETQEQIEYLLNMGCIYGQGYFFYRPMPVSEVKELLENEENVDYRGIQARKIESICFKDLFQSELASDVMLNNILGPIAIYDVCGEEAKLVQVNDKYCLLTGQDAVDLAEGRESIFEDIHEEDVERAKATFERALRAQGSGAEETVRRRKRDGSYMWINLRVFFLREQDGHRMFYGAVRDVTEEMKMRQELECLKGNAS